MSSAYRSDLALVAGVLAGRSDAISRFLDLACPVLWSVVQKLEPAGLDAEPAFLQIIEALKADAYARLKAFDGRARLSTYLALVAREVLSQRLAARLVAAPETAWSAFERFFAADIRRRIALRFPREESAWDDLYQDICVKLVEDGFRRVRAYDGRGSFAGYVLTVVDRILIDQLRRHAPRRRLPAAVARLPSLDQDIYVMVAWERCPADARRIAEALRGRRDPAPQAAEIGMALQRLAAAAALDPPENHGSSATTPLDQLAASDERSLADGSLNPEEHMLLNEEERSREKLIDAIRSAAKDLPAESRVYLQTVFSSTEPLSPREIARIMGCRVEEVYRLRQRARRWMMQFTEAPDGGRGRHLERSDGDLDHGTAATRTI